MGINALFKDRQAELKTASVEVNMKKEKKHIISSVLPGSIAEELELAPGDALLSVNGQPVEDVFDYRYLMNEEYVELLIEKADGEVWELEVEKEYEEDLGVEFENGLMDDIVPAVISAFSVLLTRCHRECVIPFTLRMMIQDFLSCREIM